MHQNGIDLVSSFVIVAQELSFRRSAEILNVDRSALTRRIKKLEALNGFALFERSTREVSLTPAGLEFYERSVDLLQNYAQSVDAGRRISEGKTGRLKIAYMAFAAPKLMPLAVSRFQREHPDIDVTLKYIATQQQKVAIAHNEIDVGYLIGPFEHSDFACHLIKSEPLYAVMPYNHPLSKKFQITLEDISRHDLILGDLTEWEFYRRQLIELFAAQGIHLNIKLEASNTLALIGLVAAGLGITVLPESLAETLSYSVEIRKISSPKFNIDTVLVWARSNRTEVVRQYVETAKLLAQHQL